MRNGTYGVRTPQPRQLYLCLPPDGGKPHAFTPALARHHVHEHEGGCVECEELRGLHHGETAVARRHSWPTRIVARALAKLAAGGSYADVSRQALAQAEWAAQRHEELVGHGLSADEADIVVEAEEDAADRGERSPTPDEALATEAGRGARRAGLDADRPRYRRQRRSSLAVAVERAAAEARAKAPAAGAEPDVAEAAAEEAMARAFAEADATRAATGTRAKSPASAESHNA